MYEGRTVLVQLLEHLPWHTFRRLVRRYGGEKRIRSFTCRDQYLCMVIAQLTYRESLRDIEACLGAVPEKLYHLGFRTRTIGRSTLADANEKRDWRIYADFAQVLIDQARRLYSGDSFVVELELTVYALDSTTIDVCLSLFPGLLPEPGSIYVLDRGYTDFARLQLLALPGDFVIRARRDFRFDRRCSRSVDG